MKELLTKIWYLFDKKDKIKIYLLFFLILSGTFTEILGFAAIIPFLLIISKPEVIQQNIYIKTVYDLIAPSSYNQFIAWIILFIIAVFLFKNLYLIFVKYFQFNFTTNIHNKLASRLFRSYLNSPYTFHLQRNSAQLLRNLGIVLSIISGIFLPLIRILTDLLLIIMVVGILMIVDFLSTLIIFGFMGLISATYFFIIKRKQRDFGQRYNHINTLLIKQFNQGLGSIKESIILGRGYYFDKFYSQYLSELNKISKWQQLTNSLPRYIVETSLVALILSIMLIMLAGGNDMQSVLITMSFFGMASVRLMPSISTLNSSINLINFYIPSLEEIYSDLKMSEYYKAPIKYEKIYDPIIFQKEIKLEQIDYTYDNSEKSVLKHINFKIPKNNTVALVGETGAGKTTVVDIILGLLKPHHGNVLVDGVNIHEKLTSWQRIAGYIPQQIYLMDDTITTNIAFGLPEEEVSMKKVNNAVRMAQLEEFINELPHGLNTIVGELGVRLSGGQRQRIGIARALYNDPELLIMDEATSSLDNETERAFMESIESLSGKRTIIIIAHRLTTVEKVDTIFFMSKGQLIASGSYNELLNTCTEFQLMAGVKKIETY